MRRKNQLVGTRNLNIGGGLEIEVYLTPQNTFVGKWSLARTLTRESSRGIEHSSFEGAIEAVIETVKENIETAHDIAWTPILVVTLEYGRLKSLERLYFGLRPITDPRSQVLFSKALENFPSDDPERIKATKFKAQSYGVNLQPVSPYIDLSSLPSWDGKHREIAFSVDKGKSAQTVVLEYDDRLEQALVSMQLHAEDIRRQALERLEDGARVLYAYLSQPLMPEAWLERAKVHHA